MITIETNDEDKCQIAVDGLYNVIDPEVGLNIVDLGLVYRLMFYDEEIPEVAILMTLTTRFCPMGDSITSATEQSLQMSFPGANVRVDLTFDPAWNSDMISEEGNKFLNGY